MNMKQMLQQLSGNTPELTWARRTWAARCTAFLRAREGNDLTVMKQGTEYIVGPTRIFAETLSQMEVVKGVVPVVIVRKRRNFLHEFGR